MTLEALLEIAATGYPDPDIFRTAAKFNENIGDDLALFLAREIRDTYDENSSDERQLADAALAVEKAGVDISDVEQALHEKFVETAARMHQAKRGKNGVDSTGNK